MMLTFTGVKVERRRKIVKQAKKEERIKIRKAKDKITLKK